MKKPYRIAIIDYQMSNMFSVRNAINLMGFESKVVSKHSEILDSDGVILPGVGSFPEAMRIIKKLGLDVSIKEFIDTGKPFLGICLGFQLLFQSSNEIEKSSGLGILKGKVVKFANNNMKILVPHVGWNAIDKNLEVDKIILNSSDPLRNVKNGDYFYFVHSYYACPEDLNIIKTRTQYGEYEFCSSILKDNIFACQFHPEKSGDSGLQVFKDMFN